MAGEGVRVQAQPSQWAVNPPSPTAQTSSGAAPQTPFTRWAGLGITVDQVPPTRCCNPGVPSAAHASPPAPADQIAFTVASLVGPNADDQEPPSPRKTIGCAPSVPASQTLLGPAL